MIHYSLTCAKGHEFDSWFQSAAAFDALAAGGHLTCAICGGAEVTKSLMAPNLGRVKAAAPPPPAPAEDQATALAALRRKIEESAEYVGPSFAAEARAIHAGDAPERSIYGETNHAEAMRLIEDGVPVAPLPFTPRKRMN